MLITEEYKALNRAMHVKKPEWGQASIHTAPMVKELCEKYGFKKLLDYGCGRMRLKQTLASLGLDVEVTGYDPGIPEHDTPPEPHDFVVCIDVLEHVEPECVDAVLDDLKRVTRRLGFFTISTVPANRKLPDGSNPHRTIKPAEWWAEKMERRFKVLDVSVQSTGAGFWVFAK
jgi:2-polyprenyl-3-methyl-5-hydroxy-6-metoxy-1,4-benzoquinol methylase